MSTTQTPALVEHTVHLLPPGTTLDEQEKVVAALHDTRSTFTYSADAAHAIAYAGTPESKVVVWSGGRWQPGNIYKWFRKKRINTKARKIKNLKSAKKGHVFTNPSRTIAPPSSIKHSIHLFPPDITLDEVKAVTTQLYSELSAFTYSADAAHALVHAGNNESLVVVWSGDRWSADIFLWLNARGVPFTSQQIPSTPVVTIGNDGFHFTHWPTEKTRIITQAYNARPEVYKQINSGLTGHEGLDILAPIGSNIYAVAPGRVEMVRKLEENHAYGIAVYIRHEGGYRTAYAHLQSVDSNIDVNTFVNGGQLLGKADSTGNVEPKDQPIAASHLHLTLYHDGATKNGETAMKFDIIDPTPFIQHLMPTSVTWPAPTPPLVTGWGYVPGLEVRGDLAKVISGSYINMRADASTTSSLIGQVYDGIVVKISGAAKNNYWPIQVSAKDVH